MTQLAVHVDFLSRFGKLEPDVQRAVQKSLLTFQEHTHAGLHLEKVRGGRDPRIRTIRVSDFWRGVVIAPERGDLHVLLRVDGHDEATAWAKQHTVSVNEVSGALQITNVERLDELAVAPAPAQRLLFSRVKDAQLARLGLDEHVRRVAATVVDLAQLESLADLLPENQYEVLYFLATGSTVDEVWAQLVAPRIPADPIDPADVAAAAARSDGRVALVDGPADLLALFERPLALWRVFLHPTQEQVAYRPSYSGSAKVTGGPGTGKTVAALHRVRHLVTSRDLPPAAVLLTTYTKGLASALERDLARLLAAGERGTVRVANVDKVAHDVVTERHGRLRYTTDAEYRAVWTGAASRLGGAFSPHFLRREWESVLFAQDLRDLDGYLAADRRGRGKRLSSSQKQEVWGALQGATRTLRATGVWTPLTVAAEAAALLAARPEPLFRHVVVDEVQDLHPAQWRMLRAAVAEGPDDLFLTGDPHQRVYAHRVNLGTVGIRVTGRSTRLTLNYRTTAEILAWALAALADSDSDDMDAGIESLLGYRASHLHGEPPELVGAADYRAENAGLVEAVRRWHDEGVGWGEIGVAARTNRIAGSAQAALREAGIPVRSSRADGEPDEVSVGTMHGMKGLEFRCVALIGVNRGVVPEPRAVTAEDEDPIGHALDLQQERSLLFVAATRARERLRVSWSGDPSPLMP